MDWKIAVLVVTAFLLDGDCEIIVTKFKVLHEAIVDCPDRGTDQLKIRWYLTKLNRTLQVMSGYITLEDVDFDDALTVRIKLWTWKNGGWKAGTGLDIKKDRGCSSFVTVLGPVWTEITNHAKMPAKCPYKRGHTYNMTEMDARVWDKLPLPAAPVNRYKLECSWETKAGQTVGCYSSIFKVAKK